MVEPRDPVADKLDTFGVADEQKPCVAVVVVGTAGSIILTVTVNLDVLSQLGVPDVVCVA